MMKKMSGRITSCCVALLLTFTMVSAVQRVLRSINDLPMDSRELLHWFANETDIDTNGVIRLTFGGDYGSHHYYNSERLLDPLPWGYQYYTLGNINQRTSQQVPSQGRNKARNIIRVREQNTGSQSQIIDQVYITRHYQEFDHHRSAYDPDQTYEITTSLLREIRGFRIDIDNRYRTDNPPIYTANYVGSANTSQSCDVRNKQAATRNNEQHDFGSNGDCLPCLICTLFIFLVFIAFFFLFNLKTKMSN